MLWSDDYEQVGTGQKGSGHRNLQGIIPAFICRHRKTMEDIRIAISHPNQI
jgi:hypothetical protein